MADNSKRFHGAINYKPLSADPTNPKEGDVFRSDGTSRAVGLWEYKQGQWQTIGGGAGGGLDVFHTETFEVTGVDNFSTGNNASFAGGGTIVGTLGLETVSPISGDQSLKYTNATSAGNDYLMSEEITVELKQQNNLCAAIFNLKYSGDDDDIRLVIYDETNDQELSSEAELIKSTSKSTRYIVQFYVPSTCTSIRWGGQTLVANNGAELIIDDVELTSNPFSSGGILSLDYDEEYILTADTTTATTLHTFTGLEIGKKYDISGQAVVSTNTNISFTCSSQVGRLSAGTSGTFAIDFSFVAEDTSLVIANTVTTTVSGDGSKNETFFQLKSALPSDTSVTAYSAKQSVNSMIRLNTGNGHGSTNTKIRRFSNTVESLGSAITYTDSATDGASFTIEEDGVYFISYTDGLSGSSTLFGVSLNSSELTTNLNSITADDRLSETVTVSNSSGEVSWSGKLSKGDIIRPHGDGGANFTGRTLFTISKIGTRDLIGIPLPLVGYVKDVKPSGTAGGTFTSGAWQTRDLNTVEGDFSKFGSLSSNQITLQAGEYYVNASAPAYSVADHKLALYDITNSSFAIIGEEARCAAGTDASNSSNFSGTIIVTEPTTFEIQHRCSNTTASTGLGRSASFGVDEIFARCTLIKLR